MKNNLLLTITSLLTILFLTLHLTSDTIHAHVGTPEAGGSTLVAVPVLALWLYGTLVLGERRSGTSSCSSGRSWGWECRSYM